MRLRLSCSAQPDPGCLHVHPCQERQGSPRQVQQLALELLCPGQPAYRPGTGHQPHQLGTGCLPKQTPAAHCWLHQQRQTMPQQRLPACQAAGPVAQMPQDLDARQVAAVPLLCWRPAWHPPQHPAGRQSLWQSPGCPAAVLVGRQQPQRPCVPVDCQPGSPVQASCLLECTLGKCPGSRVTRGTLTLHSTMPATYYEGMTSASLHNTSAGDCAIQAMLELQHHFETWHNDSRESQRMQMEKHVQISLSLRRSPD